MDTSVSTAPKLDLNSVNPLIEDDFEDTRNHVVKALRFITAAIAFTGDSMTREMASGCAMLIDTCAAALEAGK